MNGWTSRWYFSNSHRVMQVVRKNTEGLNTANCKLRKLKNHFCLTSSMLHDFQKPNPFRPDTENNPIENPIHPRTAICKTYIFFY